MNKYENALVEILNGLGRNYSLLPIEVKNAPKYLLYILTDFDDKVIELSEETYNTLLQLDKEIKGKE